MNCTTCGMQLRNYYMNKLYCPNCNEMYEVKI